MERAKLRSMQELDALWAGARLLEMLEKGVFILPESWAIEKTKRRDGLVQTHAAPLAAATSWIIVDMLGNKQVSWAAPGAELSIYAMDVILRSTEVYHSPATTSSLIKHLSMYLHCLQINVLLLSFIKTSLSFLFSMASFSWLKCWEGAAIWPWDAPSWCLLWSQPHLVFEAFFSHTNFYSTFLRNSACCQAMPDARMSHFEYTEYIRITSTLVLCSVRWPGQIFFYSILVESVEVQQCKNSLQLTFKQTPFTGTSELWSYIGSHGAQSRM